MKKRKKRRDGYKCNGKGIQRDDGKEEKGDREGYTGRQKG